MCEGTALVPKKVGEWKAAIILILMGAVISGIYSFWAFDNLNFLGRCMRTNGFVGEVVGTDEESGISTYAVGFINEKTGKTITVYAGLTSTQIQNGIIVLYDPNNPSDFRINNVNWNWIVTTLPAGIAFDLFAFFEVRFEILQRKQSKKN